MIGLAHLRSTAAVVCLRVHLGAWCGERCVATTTTWLARVLQDVDGVVRRRCAKTIVTWCRDLSSGPR